MRRATRPGLTRYYPGRNFYPRSPCGERRQNPGKHYVAFRFLSTLSLRRATSAPRITPTASRNFYPRSPCGERQDTLTYDVSTGGFLSTLSLRRATFAFWTAPSRPLFLSTLSLRRATWQMGHRRARQNYFYPRSPCGERRCLRCCAISCITISIHALLAESDT